MDIYHLEPPPRSRRRPINVAVVGCTHGELTSIYTTLAHIHHTQSLPIHLLLCCGDFQATRTALDLSTLSCPPKYRRLSSFARWWRGEEGRVPVLTVYIGGNHEASNVHVELPYGGWVCERVWYMGWAGVLRVAGWRVGGLSGIHKDAHYHCGHFERLPFSDSHMRSVYHVRHFDAWRLTLLAPPRAAASAGVDVDVDVVMSHDWPRGMERHGDLDGLLRAKPFFREDAQSNSLGSVGATLVLTALQPRYWFSGHMHVRFAALYDHGGRQTRFLALDKALPNRDWMQIVGLGEEKGGDAVDEDEHEREVTLHYDLDWLCAVRKTAALVPTTTARWTPPPGDRAVNDADRAWMRTRLRQVRGEQKHDGGSAADRHQDGDDAQLLAVPLDYHKADEHEAEDARGNVRFVRNAQTIAFCRLLDIPDPYSDAMEGIAPKHHRQSLPQPPPPPPRHHQPPSLIPVSSTNPDEIDLGDVSDG